MPNLWRFIGKKPPSSSETIEDLFVQAWQCQYDKPTLKKLADELSPEDRALYQDLRKSIAGLINAKPKLEWLGLSWCWCELTALDDTSPLIAIHLIPDPQNPRVALTLSTAFFDANPPSKLPKGLHGGLSTATAIGHQSWCEWPIGSQELVQSIQEVIKLAHSG